MSKMKSLLFELNHVKTQKGNTEYEKIIKREIRKIAIKNLNKVMRGEM